MATTPRTIVVRPRSRQAIEERADRFLAQRFPGLLKTPGRFPAAEWVEFDMPSAYGVEFIVNDIGPAVEAVTTPLDKNTWAVVMDTTVYKRMRAGDPRAAFTGIHEFGHVELHIREVSAALINGAPGLRRERGDVPVYRDAEWQAHTFAGEILAPRSAVLALLLVTPRSQWLSAICDTFGLSLRAADVRISVLRQQKMLP